MAVTVLVSWPVTENKYTVDSEEKKKKSVIAEVSMDVVGGVNAKKMEFLAKKVMPVKVNVNTRQTKNSY